MKPIRSFLGGAMLLTVMLFSCSKSNVIKEIEAEVTLKNVPSNPAGCQWCMELPDGTRIEPNNLNSFTLNLQDGMKVKVSYTLLDNEMTTCMMGTAVKLSAVK